MYGEDKNEVIHILRAIWSRNSLRRSRYDIFLLCVATAGVAKQRFHMFLVRYIKSLPFFQLPEVTFERNLDDNPVYPFTPVLLTPLDQNPGWKISAGPIYQLAIISNQFIDLAVYQYKRRLNRFYYSLVTCTTFFILSVILGCISNDLVSPHIVNSSNLAPTT